MLQYTSCAMSEKLVSYLMWGKPIMIRVVGKEHEPLAHTAWLIHWKLVEITHLILMSIIA